MFMLGTARIVLAACMARHVVARTLGITAPFHFRLPGSMLRHGVTSRKTDAWTSIGSRPRGALPGPPNQYAPDHSAMQVTVAVSPRATVRHRGASCRSRTGHRHRNASHAWALAAATPA